VLGLLVTVVFLIAVTILSLRRLHRLVIAIIPGAATTRTRAGRL
jgi:hypothetical protein